MKLSVGTKDPADLREWQAGVTALQQPLRHRTRNRPRRVADIVAGGSIYWVIAGKMSLRQRVIDIIEDHWDDGTTCAGIVLDPVLVAVEPRRLQPFQGWRYLEPEAAPADLIDLAGRSVIDPDLPPEMRRQLQDLCLI